MDLSCLTKKNINSLPSRKTEEKSASRTDTEASGVDGEAISVHRRCHSSSKTESGCMRDIIKIKSWINLMATRIELISNLPSGFTSKKELDNKILGNLRKNVFNFEHKNITNEEFMKNMQKDYAEMKKKYGRILSKLIVIKI